MIKARYALALVPVAAAALLVALAPVQAQSASGAQLFAQRCKVCHSVTPGAKGVGPNLNGVAGRKAASAPGFAYSPALKASGLSWTPANLDAYLAAPMRKVPGTRMVISVPDAAQRKALVGYLASQR
jgi:cytochrome c